MIDIILKDTFYLEHCKRICDGNEIYKDLYQYVIMSLLEMPEDKLKIIIESNPRGYISRMIWYSYKSQTSPFYRSQVFKEESLPKQLENELIDEEVYNNSMDVVEEYLKEEINKRHKAGEFAWDVEILKMQMKEGVSYHDLAKELNIPYSSIRYNLSILKKKIYEHLTNYAAEINRG